MKPPDVRPEAEAKRRRLDALCRDAHELVREWLLDSPDVPRSSKAVRLAIYRGLRRLKACEGTLRAEFVERAMAPGATEAGAYAEALDTLPLAPVVADLLRRALHRVLMPDGTAAPAVIEAPCERWFAAWSLMVASSGEAHLGDAAIVAGQDLHGRLHQYAAHEAPPARAAALLPDVGTLFDWHGAEPAPMRLKLCWRSPATGWHVFVNAAGVKTLELPLRRVLACLESAALVPVAGH